MPIFGRNTAKEHRQLGPVCDEILHTTDSTADDRAFAWNLIHEQRVGEDWGEHWFHEYGKPISPGDLSDALTAYQNDLRTQALKRYADLEILAENVARGGLTGVPEPADLLIQVTDLWSPGARLIWEYGVNNEIGKLGEVGRFDRNAETPPPLIEAILKKATVDDQLWLMEAFFTSQRAYLSAAGERWMHGETMAAPGPFWVTLATPWRKRVSQSPMDWCESVGLIKDSSKIPAWMMVVQYPVRRAEPLICPTQLEAGWYGRHFPTPPGCPKTKGGRVVEGRAEVFSKVDYRALPEYLHAPIHLFVQDWLTAELPILPVTRTVGNLIDLERDRAAHWKALCDEFAGTGGWMPRANF
jgi:hypothetical protein